MLTSLPSHYPSHHLQLFPPPSSFPLLFLSKNAPYSTSHTPSMHTVLVAQLVNRRRKSHSFSSNPFHSFFHFLAYQRFVQRVTDETVPLTAMVAAGCDADADTLLATTSRNVPPVRSAFRSERIGSCSPSQRRTNASRSPQTAGFH